MTYHTIIVVGNVGREPEMRYTPSGKPVTSFSVASNRSYQTSSGEKADETIWFRITVWDKLAETCSQYLHKGSKVLVEGRLMPDKNGSPKVFPRQDGTFGSSYEITANTVRFLSQRGEGSEGGTGESMIEEIASSNAPDDIPF